MDMNQLMKQAQQMQQRMKEAQEQLAERTIEAEAGGGMVRVTFNGKQELVELKIDPQVVQSEEVDFLEDLILAAIQSGQQRSAEMAQEAMSQITGGLNLPGLF